MNKNLIDFLKQFALEGRTELFEKVLENRTRYITVVLEDIYQPQNASAVIRSSECFGIQDVHVIENKNEYNVNPDVVLGSSKWINLVKYNKSENNTLEAIKSLKDKGYRIVATTPHKNDVLLNDFNLKNGKVALFFGTELNGLSDLMIENADEFLKIPMYGFTESFNISVSAAIILQNLTQQMRMSEIDWHLTNAEKDEIMLDWLKKTVKKSSLLIDKFLSQRNNN